MFLRSSWLLSSSSNTALFVVLFVVFSFVFFLVSPFGIELLYIQSDIYIYPISDIHHRFGMEDHRSLDEIKKNVVIKSFYDSICLSKIFLYLLTVDKIRLRNTFLSHI